MNCQWRKVVGDFREYRLQIVLIGLVLLLGTAGVIGTLNARTVLQREIVQSYDRAKPPDLALHFDRVEPSMLELIRAHQNVADADFRRIVMTRCAGPTKQWLQLRLSVVRDFEEQRIGIVHTHERVWPAADSGILIEQSSAGLLGLKIGERLQVRSPGGGIVEVPIAGFMHDTTVAPGFQERVVYGVVTPKIAEALGQESTFDQIAIKMNDRALGRSHLGAELQEQLTQQGHTVRWVETLPRTHPHALLMETMLRLLGVLAAMAFLSSAAVAAYVVALWMKREVRNVGIMKTIGATSGQLAFHYLALVGLLVMAATALAVPAGRTLGNFLIRYHQTNLNIDISRWSPAWTIQLIEIVFSTAIPLLAMSVPILRATRLSARNAIQDPGITAQAAPRSGWVRRIQIVRQPQWTFALRNVFRRPWRMTVTLTALTAAGTLFLTVNFVFVSLMSVVDATLSSQTHDLQVVLRDPAAISEIERLARQLPDVEIVEAWPRASIRFAGDPATLSGENAKWGTVTAFPPDSRFCTMPLVAGRWPRADEVDTVIIGRRARETLGRRAGETVLIQADGRPAKVMKIVGEFEQFDGPAFYTNVGTYETILGPSDRTSFFLIKAAPGRNEAAATALDLAFITAKITVASIDTRAARREVMEEHFLAVVGFCDLVAIASALVGAISLVAFGSLNVLERVREIGVIRTLGATPGRITLLFVAESSAIAAASVIFAALTATGVTIALNYLIETRAFKMRIPLELSFPALGLLAAGLVLVILGVWTATSRFIQLSVRETLNFD